MYLVVPPGGAFRDTRKIELGPRPLSIGRAESCDVRLDVPGVDNEHAKVSEVALVAMGPDCAIGDVPLDAGARRLVMPGDEIQIGSVVLALEGDDPSLMPPPLDGHDGAALSRPRDGVLMDPRIRVVEGHNFGDELVLAEENRLYVVGRAPKSDLVLEDREVSREHLKLVRRGFKVYIQDQSSTRGSWLGRSAVYQGSTIEWTRPRMLKVGATVLSLELPDAVRKAAPGAQASAGMTPPPRTRRMPGAPSPSPSAPASSVRAPGSVPPSSRAGGALDPTPLPVDVASMPGPGGSHPAPHHELPAGAHDGMTPAAGAAAPAELGTAASRGLTPVDVGSNPGIARGASSRTAWKKTGGTVGRGAGLLLLVLAGIAVLGAIFVVFSLME